MARSAVLELVLLQTPPRQLSADERLGGQLGDGEDVHLRSLLGEHRDAPHAAAPLPKVLPWGLDVADADRPRNARIEGEIQVAMDRQRDLMALRAKVPLLAPVSETPLAGKLRRHELGYKNVLDTLRSALANVESDLAVMLARHVKRPREAKKLLATLFAAPGTVRVSSRAVTVRLMPALAQLHVGTLD
jgi:hypothetical protein